ncbi:hypothetical protein ELG79_09040 [Rhizobium leguminosarum]|nr:hypothetical protein ELG79_09040 [Rhizobium leguminosarum]
MGGNALGTTAEELRIAAIGSKIEFAKSELQTVQAYIDVVYAGKIAVTTDDGSQIAELEYQQELLLYPPGEDGD